jgi:catechol 2,3-dioxygenase-like lactoylglutathione lyase family enzyme
MFHSVKLQHPLGGIPMKTHSYLGIHHVQLAAPRGCEELARSFYQQKLGMEEINKPANLLTRGGVWFQCGLHQLHIGVQEDFTPARKAHPAFLVQGLEELRKRLAATGVIVIEDEPLPGNVRFFLEDPFGNRLEFLELV